MLKFISPISGLVGWLLAVLVYDSGASKLKN